MIMRLRWIRTILLCAFAIGVQAAPATQGIPPAYERAARWEGVPARILFALALQESGLPWHGRFVPWPWTLNIDGVPLRYASLREACAGLRRALQDATTSNADVGLGQVSLKYHGEGMQHPCELLDPYRNLSVTARILREQHRPGEDWLLAVGRYHHPAGGAAALNYQHSVEAHLARITGESGSGALAHGWGYP